MFDRQPDGLWENFETVYRIQCLLSNNFFAVLNLAFMGDLEGIYRLFQMKNSGKRTGKLEILHRWKSSQCTNINKRKKLSEFVSHNAFSHNS